MIRRRFTFRGIIQGVGFRPTVYRCALSLGLTGYVQNRRSEVVAEVQGPEERVALFSERLRELLPPAARIDSLKNEEIDIRESSSFVITESLATSYSFPPIPPDLAICNDCRQELFDPADPRYLYPFITCTQCGPRYSIVEETPFDRETTSMRDFIQCKNCLREYTDPLDRRFHSQTNSCSECGPILTLKDNKGNIMAGKPLLAAIEALKEGRILALQGIGGFHLAVDPRFSKSVSRLRRDKERRRKPFALMVRDLETARKLCLVTESDTRRLFSAQSPIIILPVLKNIPSYFNSVSDMASLGIMLPYTPLHLLLFLHPGVKIPYDALIMTSGNLRNEPIITKPQEALKKLGATADLFLYHNRRILFRNDDSILQQDWGEGAVIIRRSRGIVPGLITLKRPVAAPTLALGGDLKNAPALARGKDVYLAPYLGDLDDQATRNDFENQIHKLLNLYSIRPEVMVFDLHPAYISSRYAREGAWDKKVEVQHHHAHLLSVMAEHGLNEVIGLSFDGTGYGSDGNIWGGEFMQATRSAFKRLGSFADFRLPGGGAAILNPIRIALSLVAGQVPGEELKSIFSDITGRQRELLLEIIARGINSPLTTSLGRIFDAAAALLSLVVDVSYEGEGPMKLESLAAGELERGVEFEDDLLAGLLPFREPETGPSKQARRAQSTQPAQPTQPAQSTQPGDNRLFLIDPGPLLTYLAARRKQRAPGWLALLFHEAVAFASYQGALRMREETGINELALSGGVFQNSLLRKLLLPRFKEAGFMVYTNLLAPPGDGGLALGQIYFDHREK